MIKSIMYIILAIANKKDIISLSNPSRPIPCSAQGKLKGKNKCGKDNMTNTML